MIPPQWTPACWRHTRQQVLAEHLTPDMLVVMSGVEESPVAKRNRHEARVAVLRDWLRGVLDDAADEGELCHTVRALRAWAASEPGSISAQWASLPAPIHKHLVTLCGVLGDRGGAASYGPIAGALREALHASLRERDGTGEEWAAESELDAAVQGENWPAVRAILARHDIADWQYASGDDLRPL